MKKRIINATAAAAVSGFLIGGCAAQSDPSSLQNNAARAARPSASDQQTLSAETRAKRIADAIERMADIKEAYAVVTGNTAIVGINLNGESDDARVIEVKTLVDRTVKSVDQEITHVAVTASPELVDRIIKMVGGEQTPQEETDLDQFRDDELFFRVAPTI
ncbi:MAG: YhcN/YlaJ family sporulation lipoprotein [Clostridiales bacterium]|jgi:YhcN/YlaJ family sporulation lipoprotein|nr:YhcN/YlaJ family sporulation lipoprotein [Clostridiales bacterium]